MEEDEDVSLPMEIDFEEEIDILVLPKTSTSQRHAVGTRRIQLTLNFTSTHYLPPSYDLELKTLNAVSLTFNCRSDKFHHI